MELRLIFQSKEPDYISKNYILWVRPVENNVYFYKYTDNRWQQIGFTAEIVAKIKDLYEKISAIQGQTEGLVIPTKLSELVNDTGYITSGTSSLANYYKKSEVDAKLASITPSTGSGITLSIVTTLPVSGETNVLYMLQISTGLYDEYIWNGSTWGKIGTAAVDLSSYYTKDQVDAKISTLTNNLSTLQTSYNSFVTSTNSSIEALSARVDSISSMATAWETSLKPYLNYGISAEGVKVTGNLTVTGDMISGNYKLSDLGNYALIPNINGYISDYITAHPSGSGSTTDLSNYYSKTELASYIEWLNRVMPKFDYVSTDSALKASCNIYSTAGVTALETA